MSCIIKTKTPFIDKIILCKALEEMGYECRVSGETIRVNSQGPMRNALTFERDNEGKYVLSAYSRNDRAENTLVREISTHYDTLYQERLKEIESKRLEQERIRMEEERRAVIQSRKKTIIETAKAKGYEVKEEILKDKIKLVLVRRTY